MPVARILTHHPDYAHSLSQQLEQLGYTVEISYPDQPATTHADMEIDLEVCSQSEAVDRAAELAMQLNTEIAVAPRALQFAVPAPEPEPIHVMEPPQPELVPAATLQQSVEEPAQPEYAHPEDQRVFTYSVHQAGPRFMEIAGNARQRIWQSMVSGFSSMKRGASAAATAFRSTMNFSTAAARPQLVNPREEEVPQEQEPGTVYAFRPQVKAAFAGAAAICALFILGLAIAGFEPKAALPDNMKQTLQSGVTVPASGVTVQTGGVTLSQPSTKPTPAIQLGPAPVKQSPPARHRVHRSSLRDDEDMIGNDVVVRHFPVRKKPVPTQQQAKLKRYSDLD
jgi:hypothetical protein